MYSGYRKIFNSAGSWSFYNDTARNVTIFAVHNTSSYHGENCINNYLVQGEGPTFGINGRFVSSENKFSTNFSKVNRKFCLSLHYNADKSYWFVNGKEILKLNKINLKSLKPAIKMLTFRLNFVSEAYLMDLVLLSLEKCL